jgi:hypothetical protein
MSFEDDIKAAMETSIARIEGEDTARQEFSVRWHTARDTAVAPLLERAAQAIRTRTPDAISKRDNGSITLYVKFSGVESHLKFSPDSEKREVTCQSTAGEGWEQSLALDALTVNIVQEMCVRFASDLAATRAPERRGSWGYG